ncbi:23S rRNA (cytidine1920-2'-O)/16S rRNA (cytidine1409-2'-O)-methyltransferase [Breoghania corrubedonensis]|uniref:23S rRNA (Cytidine1920-2'-O)/16S rRNA (Cytidine1409-2'-O)-methyltransferase n=1 Tax=Breoghania corrubedonensis TaxID=665038 RepID=A0A2T5VEM3_9HYPH|nr:TlyA family RNA methyltransferase [Breoghania corrubedonensis]PTW62176.1 23S rRNA (cytidine1920-2'-O)/16S rRNA (cytidine1409-2'-O)-methyltransferase [Breoghania corrubedonensis]
MTKTTAKLRLDQLLVERGLAESRARARDAILRGHVLINGQAASKPGQTVAGDAEIAIDDPAAGYVSRAALKLIAGLDAFAIDVDGCRCLDIGASTGGFTQVLLARGAASVDAIDVGHDQLHPSLAADPRVHSLEGVNARALGLDHLTGAPEIVVSDVSFISLKLALPPALGLAAPGARALFLVKPQFEAGKERIGKGGLVDPEVAETVADDIRHWLAIQPGWRVLGMVPSPIKGGDGNGEYLLGAVKEK